MVLIASVVGAVLLSSGGWTLYGRITGRPQTVAQVKRSIWKSLAKQTHRRNFKPPFDYSAAQIVGVTSITNKAGRVRITSKAAKKGSFGLPETTLSTYFRTNQEQVASYEQMYRLIGEQLTVTEQLLKSAETPLQLTALVMASEASIYARTNAHDLWLGARIGEAYLLPNLSLVESTNSASLTTDMLLNVCELAFKEAAETNNMIRTYEQLIAKALNSQQADLARFRLARIYQELGKDADALGLLKKITTLKSPKVQQDISILEIKLQAKKR